MEIKARPNHERYVEILRRMTPAQRLDKAFELTEYARSLMKAGLRRAHPGVTEAELHALYVRRLIAFHKVADDQER